MKKIPNIIVKLYNNGISRIKLNKPNTYNSLSSSMLKSLLSNLKYLNNNKKTKVIIIEGSGKGFSAGHDLKEIRNLKKNQNIKYYLICVQN